MNPDKRYLVSRGDFLQGKGIPNTKIKALFTPGKIKKTVQVSDNGGFIFQVPEDLDLKTYTLTIANIGKNDNLVFAKGYRIRIQSNNRILQNTTIQNIIRFFQPKNARALDGTPGTDYDWERLIGPDWVDWLKLWYQTGICPAIDDNGEIIYLNKQVFDEIYPGYICDAYESLDEWSAAMERDQQFFVQLYIKLNENGWPEESFIDYFPNWKQFLAENRTVKFDSIPKAAYKHYGETIDPETLTNYISELLITSNLREKSSPLRIIANTADPLLSTRAMYNVYYGYKFTNNWDRINAILGLLAFIPASAVDRVAYKLSIESYQIERTTVSMAAKRQAIKDGAIITQQDITVQTGKSGWNNLRYTNLQAGNLPLPKIYPEEADAFWYTLRNFVPKNLVFSLQPDYTRNIMDRVINAYRTLAKNGVIESIPMDMRGIYETIENQWVIGVADNIWYVMHANEAQALATGRSVFIKWSSLTAPDAEYILAHEFIHVIAYRIQGRSFVKGKYFEFDRAAEDEYTRFMSFLYEIATDDLAVFATGGNSAYRAKLPELYDSAHKLVSYMSQITNNYFSWNDLRSFALTADDALLMRKVIGKEDPEAFMQFVKQIVDMDKLMKVTELENVPLLIQSVPDKNQLALLGYTGVASSFDEIGNQILTTPPLYKSDGNILLENITPTTTIQLISAYVENQGINVTTLVTQDGNPIEDTKLTTRWYLEDLSLNRTSLEEKAETCTNGCIIGLPQDLTAGTYVIVVELFKPGTEEVLASSSQSFEFSKQSGSDPLEPVGPNFCEYAEWSDVEPYDTSNGYSCYNDWYVDISTNCQPAHRSPHYHCEPQTPTVSEPQMSCEPSQWSDKETSGEYVCRGSDACYKQWSSSLNTQCEPLQNGEYCEYNQDCATQALDSPNQDAE